MERQQHRQDAAGRRQGGGGGGGCWRVWVRGGERVHVLGAGAACSVRCVSAVDGRGVLHGPPGNIHWAAVKKAGRAGNWVSWQQTPPLWKAKSQSLRLLVCLLISVKSVCVSSPFESFWQNPWYLIRGAQGGRGINTLDSRGPQRLTCPSQRRCKHRAGNDTLQRPWLSFHFSIRICTAHTGSTAGWGQLTLG